MKRNEIYTHEDDVFRVLLIKDDNCLVIDCNYNSMPVWMNVGAFCSHSIMSDEDLYSAKGFFPVEDDTLAHDRRRIMHERYSMIAPVISFIGNEKTRSQVIDIIAKENKISKQTIRAFLKKYLVFQSIQILLPKEREYETALTKDQKNM